MSNLHGVETGINVLSCFDGISCGQLALQRAGIKVNNYFASEIDKYAISITQKNFPNTVQLGNILGWESWDLPKIDLLIAGSPCQGFSNAGKGLNFEDPRSRLFFVFCDILRTRYNENPDLKYMLENVRMKKIWRDVITNYMKVEPVLIDSALVSAQSRKRLYWANWNISQPEDRFIYLKDIIEGGEVDREKSYCIDANYFKGGNPRRYFTKSSGQLVRLPQGAAIRNQVTKRGTEEQLNVRKDGKSNCVVPSFPNRLNGVVVKTIPHGYIEESHKKMDKYPSLCAQRPDTKHLLVEPKNPSGMIRAGIADNLFGHDIQRRVYSKEGKSPTLVSNSTGGSIPPKIDIRKKSKTVRVGGQKPPAGSKQVWDNVYLSKEDYRGLTVLECERLQTLPDGYTEGVSNTQRYKCVGNGWTVDVIAHILSEMPHD